MKICIKVQPEYTFKLERFLLIKGAIKPRDVCLTIKMDSNRMLECKIKIYREVKVVERPKK